MTENVGFITDSKTSIFTNWIRHIPKLMTRLCIVLICCLLKFYAFIVSIFKLYFLETDKFSSKIIQEIESSRDYYKETFDQKQIEEDKLDVSSDIENEEEKGRVYIIFLF